MRTILSKTNDLSNKNEKIKDVEDKIYNINRDTREERNQDREQRQIEQNRREQDRREQDQKEQYQDLNKERQKQNQNQKAEEFAKSMDEILKKEFERMDRENRERDLDRNKDENRDKNENKDRDRAEVYGTGQNMGDGRSSEGSERGEERVVVPIAEVLEEDGAEVDEVVLLGEESEVKSDGLSDFLTKFKNEKNKTHDYNDLSESGSGKTKNNINKSSNKNFSSGIGVR